MIHTDNACTDSLEVTNLLLQVSGSLIEQEALKGCLQMSAWGRSSKDLTVYLIEEARRASRLTSEPRPNECQAPVPCMCVGPTGWSP